MAERPPGAARGGSAPGHIVLVGLPGAGKTTVGRELARRLGLPFLDFDEEIVRREGRSVAAIFERDGECAFRMLEAALTREVLAAPPMVVSPGGGWIEQPAAEDLLAGAILVHLRVSPKTALIRMGAATQERPLISGVDQFGKLTALWTRRRKLYEAADVEVDTEMLDIEEVAAVLVRLISRSAS